MLCVNGFYFVEEFTDWSRHRTCSKSKRFMR
jgi:hypothetical protein